MNAIVKDFQVPTVAGTPFGGGYYNGLITFAGDTYATIVAPRDSGEHDLTIWHPDYTDIVGAGSFFDGFANTKAMAEAGSELAKWALSLQINGESDWYLPSRDELELAYRHFKPTDDDNYVYRNGDNPSSLPVGYPYALHLPGQTPVELFRKGAPEAFEDTWYWSSTQRSANGAWSQLFTIGNQYYASKLFRGRARAVRRIKIS